MAEASGRTKHCLLLNHAEFDELQRALREIHPLDKSFLLFEAIKTGLSRADEEIKSTRRTCKAHFWLPKDIARQLKQLAKVKATTQQSLIREFLFQYLANPPWERTTSGRKTESDVREEHSTTPIQLGSPELSAKGELLTEDERVEYERLKRELPEVLKKLGGYEPAVDDICIDQIAKATIYSRRVEIFLDSDTATEYTYSRVTDIKLKLWKTIDDAIRELAVSRRDRIAKETESGLMNELREAMLRELKRSEQR